MTSRALPKTLRSALVDCVENSGIPEGYPVVGSDSHSARRNRLTASADMTYADNKKAWKYVLGGAILIRGTSIA